MRSVIKNSMLAMLIYATGLSSSFAFFGGMMKGMMGMGQQMMPMMPQNMMNPTQMMMQMCGSGAGQMGAGMMNMGTSMMGMVPFFGGMAKGMKNSMSSSMMSQILQNPQQTLQALDCAKRNDEMVTMMLQTINSDQSLIYKMGDSMIENGAIAKSVMELAIQKPRVGRLLLQKIDPIVFRQLTLSLIKHEGMAYDATYMISQHRHEFLRQGSTLMRVFSGWNTYESDDDGVEDCVEKFIYAVFSNIEAANLFMWTLENIDPKEKEYILDVIFMGRLPNHFYDYTNNRWVDGEFKRQSFYNLYTLIFALKDALFKELKTATPSKEDFPEEAQKLMQNMMKYMLDKKTMRPTRWGMRFMNVLMAGAQMHRDPDIQAFAGFLIQLMPPRFEEGLPHELPEDAPVPRKSYL